MTMSLRRGERSAPPARPAGQDRAGEAHPRSQLVSSPATSSRGPPRARRSRPSRGTRPCPRLMPRIGTSTGDHGLDRAQERAVAAEHDQHVGRRRARAHSAVGLVRRDRPVLDAVHPAPAGRALAELDRLLDGRVVREPDAADGHAPSPARSAPHAAATASSIRSPSSAHDGPAWSWTRNSRLPSGPWIGDAMTARVPSPSSAAAAAISRDHPAVDRRRRARRRPSPRPGRPRTAA